MPCRLVRRYQRFAASIFFYLVDGSSRLLWNVGIHLTGYRHCHDPELEYQHKNLKFIGSEARRNRSCLTDIYQSIQIAYNVASSQCLMSPLLVLCFSWYCSKGRKYIRVLISFWLLLFSISLLAAHPKEFFLGGLKKLEQQSHKCVELRGEYIE
jgi:hypothetical protein